MLQILLDVRLALVTSPDQSFAIKQGGEAQRLSAYGTSGNAEGEVLLSLSETRAAARLAFNVDLTSLQTAGQSHFADWSTAPKATSPDKSCVHTRRPARPSGGPADFAGR